jgi:hypothetical protein
VADALLWSVVPLILAAVGVTLLVYDAKEVRMLTCSLEWPQVQGKVRSAKVAKDTGGEAASYSAEIKYAYEVDGVGYESDRVHFGGGSSSQQAASDMVFKYRIGHDVSVYYDPDDPSISVLDRKMVGQTMNVMFGVALTGAGSLGICVGIYQFFN